MSAENIDLASLPTLDSTRGHSEVRVRFCPSPTGTPHIGMVRTALFNWAYAKRTGGTLVFRIEDTDQARDSEESYNQLLEAMRWLGITSTARAGTRCRRLSRGTTGTLRAGHRAP